MEQRSNEWYNARIGKFSGSGASALMSSVKIKRALNNTTKQSVIDFIRMHDDQTDLSKMTLNDLKELADTYPERMLWELSDGTQTYIEQKAAEYLTGLQVEIPMTFDMERGISLEPIAIEEWNAIYDTIAGDTPGFIPYNDHVGGSPDFLGMDADGLVVGAEFKCPNQYNHMKYIARISAPEDLLSVHKNYYWQVIFYMLVCEADQWHWVSYHPDFPSNNVHRIIFEKEDPGIQSSLEQLKFALTNAVEEKERIIDMF